MLLTETTISDMGKRKTLEQYLLCMGGRADDSARTLAPPLLCDGFSSCQCLASHQVLITESSSLAFIISTPYSTYSASGGTGGR